MELADAPDERVVGDDAAEGDADTGGVDDVAWDGEADEDLRKELVGDRQQSHCLAALWRREGEGEVYVLAAVVNVYTEKKLGRDFFIGRVSARLTYKNRVRMRLGNVEL